MSQRLAYIFCLMTVAIILATGLYLEYFDGIMPCPLCTLQRICFISLGVLFFLGILLARKRILRAIINIMIILLASTGAGLAARQIWIQYFPSAEQGECGVSLQYMLQVLPLQDVVHKIFSGTAECTQRGWEFLGMNIPEWSLVFFIAFALISCYYLLATDKKQ